MDRLAIYGWTDSTPALVRALAAHATLEVCAVGDERPSELARARAALGVPCFQHVREMTRVADFEVALIGAGEQVADVAESAALRGADLLLDGASAEGETLSRAAAAADRYGVALVVLRPWLRAPGLPAVTARLAASPPDLLLIDAVEDRPTMALLRDLVALTARIAGAEALDVAASVVGPAEEPSAIAVQLRLPDGRVASITARRSGAESLRLVASGGGDSLTLVREGATTTIEGSPDTPAETILCADFDLLEAEARRVAEARASGSADTVVASGEGAILGAIERALAGDFAEHLDGRSKPALRLLRGGGHPTQEATRRGTLSLVPSLPAPA